MEGLAKQLKKHTQLAKEHMGMIEKTTDPEYEAMRMDVKGTQTRVKALRKSLEVYAAAVRTASAALADVGHALAAFAPEDAAVVSAEAALFSANEASTAALQSTLASACISPLQALESDLARTDAVREARRVAELDLEDCREAVRKAEAKGPGSATSTKAQQKEQVAQSTFAEADRQCKEHHASVRADVAKATPPLIAAFAAAAVDHHEHTLRALRILPTSIASAVAGSGGLAPPSAAAIRVVSTPQAPEAARREVELAAASVASTAGSSPPAAAAAEAPAGGAADDSGSAPAGPAGRSAQAQFDFTARTTQEVTVETGEVMDIVSVEGGGSYYKVRVQKSGKVGLIPASFIRIL